MKVPASADVHGMRPVYDWLLAAAREHRVQVIILAGDLLGVWTGSQHRSAQQHEASVLVQLL
jgi:Icc-related predicted phosphoesterase